MIYHLAHVQVIYSSSLKIKEKGPKTICALLSPVSPDFENIFDPASLREIKHFQLNVKKLFCRQ